jgi:hypothetical protein
LTRAKSFIKSFNPRWGFLEKFSLPKDDVPHYLPPQRRADGGDEPGVTVAAVEDDLMLHPTLSSGLVFCIVTATHAGVERKGISKILSRPTPAEVLDLSAVDLLYSGTAQAPIDGSAGVL